ncbi:hypothetical protein HZA55_08125 [Candidatus Poribacteria bacterium]|nr:hypothetical protein [Candidatus Poribacteria bacterium]
MKIISITGATSSVGKTYVSCALLKLLHGWAALKITRCKEGKCPKNKGCNVCHELKEDFQLVNDPEIIGQKNTDTWKMRQSGASQVFWLKTKPKALEKAVNITLDFISRIKIPGILIEGNSFLETHSANLSIMIIMDPDIKKFKPSAVKIKEKIDLFLIRKKLHHDRIGDNNSFILTDNLINTNFNENWTEEILRRINAIKR